ncbi:MAG: hypothetical protein AAF211_00205 [Myxococcota bacterium]
MVTPQTVTMEVRGYGFALLSQLRQELNNELDALGVHPACPDEIGSWRPSVLGEIEKAESLASRATDPDARGAAFLCLSRLADYARLSRLTGVGTPDVRFELASLASTLDEAAAAIRVAMGEAVSGYGCETHGASLGVSAGELRLRWDGVQRFLRLLDGTHAVEQDDPGKVARNYQLLLDEVQRRCGASLAAVEGDLEASVERAASIGEGVQDHWGLTQHVHLLESVAAAAEASLAAAGLDGGASQTLEALAGALRILTRAFRLEPATTRLAWFSRPYGLGLPSAAERTCLLPALRLKSVLGPAVRSSEIDESLVRQDLALMLVERSFDLVLGEQNHDALASTFVDVASHLASDELEFELPEAEEPRRRVLEVVSIVEPIENTLVRYAQRMSRMDPRQTSVMEAGLRALRRIRASCDGGGPSGAEASPTRTVVRPVVSMVVGPIDEEHVVDAPDADADVELELETDPLQENTVIDKDGQLYQRAGLLAARLTRFRHGQAALLAALANKGQLRSFLESAEAVLVTLEDLPQSAKAIEVFVSETGPDWVVHEIRELEQARTRPRTTVLEACDRRLSNDN